MRKLVAVVVADVVGYSRLMERDEAGTHARIRELRERLFDLRVAEHGGRTVKTTGDGLLLEFASATSALRCAVEVQREMGARNLYVAPDERIEYRIGINLGDIIVEGDDIIGDGVNVAARLETLAEPGGICVASAIREQVHEDLGIDFIDAGEKYVKNISKPVRIYRVALGKGSAAHVRMEAAASASLPRRFGGQRAAIAAGALFLVAAVAVGVWQLSQRTGLPATASAAAPPPRSIMVLPFRAPAGDASLEALAETLGAGVTRALANSLKVAQIVPPGIAYAYKGTPLDVRAVGREANVRYLVEGEVRAAGDEIGVIIRLTDTVVAKELASERQSVSMARLPQDQDLLVTRLTSAARLMLVNADDRRLAAEPNVATDARSLVDRADAIMFKGGDLPSARAARKLYSEAIDKDPGLVPAWLGRANTLFFEHENDLAAGRNDQVLSDLDRDTRRAVALDDRDARAWGIRAQALRSLWQYDAALEAADRGIALDPTRFWLLWERAWILVDTDRPAEALKVLQARNAMSGSPDSESLHVACHAHALLGQYEDAIAECGRAVANDNNYWTYLTMTVAYAQIGDAARAEVAKAKMMQRVPDLTITRLEEKFCEKSQCSDHERFRTIFIGGLRKAGVPE